LKRVWLVFSVFALFSPALLAADQIRALVVEILRLPVDPAFEKTVELALEEGLVVELPAESSYLTGVRVELVLSNLLKKHFDSFALAVYSNLEPAPQRAVRFYQGNRALLQYLPFLNRIYLQLPVGEPASQEQLPVGTYTLQRPLERGDFPILIVMIPLAKGVPDSVSASKFYFSVKPAVRKQGLVEIRLRHPAGTEKEPLKFYIDDQQVDSVDGPLELESGMHQLRVVSVAFREVNLGFAVESGKSTSVEVNLEEVVGQLTIDAPQGAELYLDGEKLPGKVSQTIPVAEGAHLLRVKIADYSVSKKFAVQPGRHYHLSVVFDIIVVED
jgi:hypothetical protein